MEISPFSLRYRRRHGGRWQRQLATALAELPAGRGPAPGHPAPGGPGGPALRGPGGPGLRPERWRPLAPPGPGFFVQAAPAPVWAGTPEPGQSAGLAHHPRRLPGGFCGRGIPPGPAGPGASSPPAHLTRRRRDLAAGTLPGPAPPAVWPPRHRRVVHLGGWEHLVDWQDSPGLWGDLADLQPRRLLLDEADRLPVSEAE